MTDDYDEPAMRLEISSRERSLLLIALWNDHVKALRENERIMSAPGFEQIKFDAILVHEATFDLVRKLGGDPCVRHFGLAD